MDVNHLKITPSAFRGYHLFHAFWQVNSMAGNIPKMQRIQPLPPTGLLISRMPQPGVFTYTKHLQITRCKRKSVLTLFFESEKYLTPKQA